MSLASDAQSAVAELTANVSTGFETARAMPKSVYTSEAVAALETQKIFAREWVCVGRSSSLEKPGDYLTLTLTGEPVLVMRDKDGVLRALSNVCLHRMSTLLEGRGNRRVITCPYHGWAYNTDGCLRGAPAMKHNAAFTVSDYRLPEFRCEEWLGWVMVSLNKDARPVAEEFSAVAAMIEDYDMAHYREAFSEDFVWNTNWKVLAENFMESYHLPVCHAGTIGGLSKLDEMVCPPGEKNFNYHTILKDPSFTIGVAHPSNTRLRGDRRRMTYLLALYPTLLITLTPGYFWYLSLQPLGASQVQVHFGGGMSDDFLNDPDTEQHFTALKTLLDEVNVEDKGCTERVYRGLRSAAGRPGHLSHLERPNFDFAVWLSERLSA
jgi:phenylpropionate dioxygenase-like ring-hydroxylating dioxygenase large terminal subunit